MKYGFFPEMAIVYQGIEKVVIGIGRKLQTITHSREDVKSNLIRAPAGYLLFYEGKILRTDLRDMLAKELDHLVERSPYGTKGSLGVIDILEAQAYMQNPVLLELCRHNKSKG